MHVQGRVEATFFLVHQVASCCRLEYKQFVHIKGSQDKIMHIKNKSQDKKSLLSEEDWSLPQHEVPPKGETGHTHNQEGMDAESILQCGEPSVNWSYQQLTLRRGRKRCDKAVPVGSLPYYSTISSFVKHYFLYIPHHLQSYPLMPRAITVRASGKGWRGGGELGWY